MHIVLRKIEYNITKEKIDIFISTYNDTLKRVLNLLIKNKTLDL